MDILKSLFSVGAFAAVAYFFGGLLIEIASFEDKSFRVPRSRKQMYIVRAFSFFEYITFIVLAFAGVILLRHETTLFYAKILLIILGISFLLRTVVMFVNTKKIRKWIKTNRFVTHVGNIIMFSWMGSSFYLFTLSTNDIQIYLSGVLTGYLLIVVVFLKAALLENPLNIHISLTMRSGDIIDDSILVEENIDSYVLGEECKVNTIIPKADVTKARVWLDWHNKDSYSNCTKDEDT